MKVEESEVGSGEWLSSTIDYRLYSGFLKIVTLAKPVESGWASSRLSVPFVSVRSCWSVQKSGERGVKAFARSLHKLFSIPKK